MKYRIVRMDKLNWRIEQWTEGGVGPKGQKGEARWKGLESYHPSLRHAALSLLDLAAGDALLADEARTLLDALASAECRVLAALPEAAAEAAPLPS